MPSIHVQFSFLSLRRQERLLLAFISWEGEEKNTPRDTGMRMKRGTVEASSAYLAFIKVAPI